MTATSESCVGEVWRNWEKAHTSAVVIIPPEHCWPQIQDIRRTHDKAYKRWMPHINLLYPFIIDDKEGTAFSEAEDAIRSALADVRPFTIHFDKNSFRSFAHGKSHTLWLKPVQAPAASALRPALDNYSDMHEAVLRLQRRLQDTFPVCTELSSIDRVRGFTPHLSLGQFKPNYINESVNGFSSRWNHIQFDVTSLHVISRKGYDDPFVIRKTVDLTNQP